MRFRAGMAFAPVLAFALALALFAAAPLRAQDSDLAYADKLLRLAEILGSIHHLRDVCGANEGQLWREQMLKLLEVEDPTGQVRSQLIAAFNNGYRGYRRTYTSCTATATTAGNRFLTEASQLSNELALLLDTPSDGKAESDEPAAR